MALTMTKPRGRPSLRLTDDERARGDELLARMLARSERLPNGCLVWTGALTKPGGYGRFTTSRRRTWTTHRLVYALLNGDPDDLDEVDHTCHTDECGMVGCDHRRCLEPSHLEAVDPRENAARQLRRVGARTGACPTCKTPRDAWPQA